MIRGLGASTERNECLGNMMEGLGVMAGIEALYEAMKKDDRLQRNWERNQPRLDRALESPLIARTPREVATATLLAAKLKFEPCAERFREIGSSSIVMEFARSLDKRVATRLLKVLQGTEADHIAKAAVVHSLSFYADRAGDNPLVRLPWSPEALSRLATASPAEVINAALKPTLGVASTGTCVARLCGLFLSDVQASSDIELRARLRSKEFPGLGPERADAVGVFAFQRPWPIVDDYLWRLLYAHGVITEQEFSARGYDSRRRVFEPHWRRLMSANHGTPNAIAATLYLWADEASKSGYRYELWKLDKAVT